jgi:hypothetical protein
MFIWCVVQWTTDVLFFKKVALIVPLKGFVVELIDIRRIIDVAVAFLFVTFHTEYAGKSKTDDDRDNGDENKI